uniref:NADH-ubiquinone oxidoreductase chain 5 n=1 Tax=Tetrodontophora bielanensis TaxID=48717 RepID=Q9B510_TETBI|nr:NADH dehydrogenase subunit 5 [Tetrodontophora bielanensis]AAK30947.1 NADH dehydrogenase subunit 5 [Tetrodontophora bielanensis]
MHNYFKISMYFGCMLFIFSVMSLVLGLNYYSLNKVIFIEWELYSMGSVSIIMTLFLDWMSLTFMGFVLVISSMVLIYSTIYMSGEVYFVRFIWMVYLFVVSMVLLIISPNMISILLGWDGLGLVSYCLVIYYQNIKSANAGMLTILSNRVGDVAILLCISWMFNYGGWNSYYLPMMFTSASLWVVGSLVIIAALTSSAQIPFSAWLPAAMAAPTPVSSLVHSSTLVTAGVFLLIRFSSLVGVSLFLMMISLWTMFMAGMNANLEMDLKKIIALSTLSQLGVMMMTISLGLSEMAFMHLLSHALFKSLLFLCAGVFIHGMGDTQDIRGLGGVSMLTPVTSLYFLGCSLSLCGFPFLSGFYSSDMILENYFLMGGLNYMIYSLVLISILMTGVYSMRLAYMLFLKPVGGKKLNNLGEDLWMISPMSILFYLAVMGGSFMLWSFMPPLLIVLSLFMKLMVLLFSFILMSSLYFFMSASYLEYLLKANKLIMMGYFGNMMNMPILSTSLFMPMYSYGLKLVKNLDQGWVEYMMGQGFMLKISVLYDSSYYFNYLNMSLYFSLFIMLVVICLVII